MVITIITLSIINFNNIYTSFYDGTSKVNFPLLEKYYKSCGQQSIFIFTLDPEVSTHAS